VNSSRQGFFFFVSKVSLFRRSCSIFLLANSLLSVVVLTFSRANTPLDLIAASARLPPRGKPGTFEIPTPKFPFSYSGTFPQSLY